MIFYDLPSCRFSSTKLLGSDSFTEGSGLHPPLNQPIHAGRTCCPAVRPPAAESWETEFATKRRTQLRGFGSARGRVDPFPTTSCMEYAFIDLAKAPQCRHSYSGVFGCVKPGHLWVETVEAVGQNRGARWVPRRFSVSFQGRRGGLGLKLGSEGGCFGKSAGNRSHWVVYKLDHQQLDQFKPFSVIIYTILVGPYKRSSSIWIGVLSGSPANFPFGWLPCWRCSQSQTDNLDRDQRPKAITPPATDADR